MNKPVAIVLGGTVPHVHLIELLKLQGYYTVLVDYTTNPPAKKFADEHIKESTLDKDGVELSFKLLTYSYNAETLQLADMMQAQLAEVGIGIEIETMDVMIETEQDGDFDIVIDSYAMAPIRSFLINIPSCFSCFLFSSLYFS